MNYANGIETLVLLTIVVDLGWHQLDAWRDRRRQREAERYAIQREEALEQRNIKRERQEILRKHWQELQLNLMSLHRAASHLANARRFVEEHPNPESPDVKQAFLLLMNRLPVILSDFGDYWGRVVTQLNVLPEPKNDVALQVWRIAEEIGKSVGDQSIPVSDQTLLALAQLVPSVSKLGELDAP